MSNRIFRKNIIASSIAMVLTTGAAPVVMAADAATEEEIEVIQVSGIRGSTKRVSMPNVLLTHKLMVLRLKI
jgi:hypothetical protein